MATKTKTLTRQLTRQMTRGLGGFGQKSVKSDKSEKSVTKKEKWSLRKHFTKRFTKKGIVSPEGQNSPVRRVSCIILRGRTI